MWNTGICPQGAATSTSCPSGGQTTTKANFDQWYRDVDGVNLTRVTTLSMAKKPGDVYQFPATFGASFFPLDGLGWVSQGSETTSAVHNFSFTSEIRHWFEFRGGERLTFSGDDDVWVFINGKLALDLGGLHSRQQNTIVLDADTGEAHCSIDGDGNTPCATPKRALGLNVGSVYEVALFHAERKTSQSNFDLTLGGFTSASSECASVCGDGVRTPDEACDDGANHGSNGECSPAARAARAAATACSRPATASSATTAATASAPPLAGSARAAATACCKQPRARPATTASAPPAMAAARAAVARAALH